MNTQFQSNTKKTLGLLYNNQNSNTASDYIYDQTYKSYKIKQKFEKDPKYNYFNAVMQMKRKLSSKQQVYKKVFEPKDNQQQPKQIDPKKTFYSRFNQSMIQPQSDVVRVQKLKRNSFKIMRQQPSLDGFTGAMKKYPSQVSSMNRTTSVPYRTGHKSNMSLYQKHNTTHLSFEMITKARNNKSYVELEVTQKPIEVQYNQTFYQPSNPKPRLEQIMQEYRKINRHSHQPKSRKSTLPKQFIQKLYQTNRMFYSNANNKKRTSLY